MMPKGGCPSLLPSLLTNWAENEFQYKFFQPTSVRWAGKTYTEIHSLPSSQVGWKKIY